MSVLFVVRTNTLEQTNIDRSEGCLRYGVSLRYIWCQNNYNTDLFLSIHQIIYSQAILMLVFILGWQNYKFFVRIQCIMNSIWFCTFVLLILLFQHIKHYISFLTLRMERQNIKHNLFSFDILHLHVMSTATVQREIKSEV